MPREGHDQICILKSAQAVVEKTVGVRWEARRKAMR